MKKKSFACFILSLIIAFGACNDPVFYIISIEPPIAEPLISGSPTNFVVFQNTICVASGKKIYGYGYDEKKWDVIPAQPKLEKSGKILQLAATDDYLYALCYKESGNITSLKRMSFSGSWEEVEGETGGFNLLQSVYATQNKVFIGAEKDNAFIILYIDEAYNLNFKPLIGNEAPVAMLCGLASGNDNYYLCTKGDTIFVAPADAPETITPRQIENDRFAGIINLGINVSGTDIIVAISRSGSLYTVDPSITQVPDVSFGTDHSSTGALTVWKETDGTPRLLLAGRQDRLDYSYNSGYTYGYLEVEVELDSAGIKDGGKFAEPGKASPSSVADNGRYVSTIGKYPVNHIFQASNGILFASTQKNGVWSYKERNGIHQWNAEEE